MVRGYKVAPMGKRDVEEKAAGVRVAMDLDPLLPLPGVELFERVRRYHVQVGNEPIPLTYGVEEEIEQNALACATYDAENKEIALVLSAASYAELERGHGRARFSVAHELGHAALHADKLVQLTKLDHHRRAMMRSDTAATPVYRDSEWQANAFAGAILMPAPGLEWLYLRGRLSVKDLSAMYKVSWSCAERRIKTFLSDRRNLLVGWN